METLRSELTFGQILRGLQVYGYQIVDNSAIAQAVVTLSLIERGPALAPFNYFLSIDP